MDDIQAVKAAARERAKSLKLPYAGALLPREAHALMQAGDARLVDVRTHAELHWVGRIPGALPVEWSAYPGGRLNPDFLSQLAELVDPDEPVMFICRSGGRSHHAAVTATEAGYQECYNVLEGFEGDKDPNQQRNRIGGWRIAGLPWLQS